MLSFLSLRMRCWWSSSLRCLTSSMRLASSLISLRTDSRACFSSSSRRRSNTCCTFSRSSPSPRMRPSSSRSQASRSRASLSPAPSASPSSARCACISCSLPAQNSSLSRSSSPSSPSSALAEKSTSSFPTFCPALSSDSQTRSLACSTRTPSTSLLTPCLSSFFARSSTPAFRVSCTGFRVRLGLRSLPARSLPAAMRSFSRRRTALSPKREAWSSMGMGLLFLGRREDSVSQPYPLIYYMERESKSNRSLLAMAGQRTLTPHSPTPKPPAPPAPPAPSSLYLHRLRSSPSLIREQPPPPSASGFDPRQIIKRLGLGRLRKMQALVRGFLVRRQVYPRELESYLVAQSVTELLAANVIYREVSGLVVETVALGHHDQPVGEDRLLEEHLYNAVIRRVIEGEFLPIARQAVYETALYASRPEVTFGFNLRDPLELTLFLRLNALIEEESRGVAELALREEATERRELQVVDQLIAGMGVVGELAAEVVEECLLEGVQEYAAESILARVVAEGARVAAEVVYNGRLREEEEAQVGRLAETVEEWLLQECLLAFAGAMPANHRPLPDRL